MDIDIDLIVGLIILMVGTMFTTLNKRFSEFYYELTGPRRKRSKFYAKLYTEKNIKIFVSLAGVVLIAWGVFLLYNV